MRWAAASKVLGFRREGVLQQCGSTGGNGVSSLHVVARKCRFVEVGRPCMEEAFGNTVLRDVAEVLGVSKGQGLPLRL